MRNNGFATRKVPMLACQPRLGIVCSHSRKRGHGRSTRTKAHSRRPAKERANALPHLAAAVQKRREPLLTAMNRSSIAVSMETARARLKMQPLNPGRLRETGVIKKMGGCLSATSLNSAKGSS